MMNAQFSNLLELIPLKIFRSCLFVLVSSIISCEEKSEVYRPVIQPSMYLDIGVTGAQDFNVVLTIQDFGTEPLKEYGFVIGVSPNPTTSDKRYTYEVLRNKLRYYTAVNGLKINTNYYVRPYALMEEGTIFYFDEVSVRTNPHRLVDFSPTIVSAGTKVTIEGENFLPGLTEIFVNNVQVDSVSLWGSLTFIMPSKLPQDSIILSVVVDGNKIDFKKKMFYRKGRWKKLKTLHDDPEYGSYTLATATAGRGFLISAGVQNSKMLYQYNPATDSWADSMAFPGNSGYMQWFAARNKIYCLQVQNQVFLEFDLTSKVWKEKPNHPFVNWKFASVNGFGFANNDNAYVGMGWIQVPGKSETQTSRSVWRYNINEASWKQMNDFPGKANSAIRVFAAGELIFLVGGFMLENSTQVIKELWQYDMSTDSWKRLSDYPGAACQLLNGFVLNGKLYVGGGETAGYPKSQHNDFYEYDPSTDKWIRIADLPDKRSFMYSFSIADEIYIGGGFAAPYGSPSPFHDLWKFELN